MAEPITSREHGRPLLVSFSGVDGAGKSTQIENLRAAAQAAGYRVRLLAFWDDVVVGCRFREGFVHKAYKSERGIGAPGKPVARRDKNVRRWYLTLLRHALYLLDSLHLAWVAARLGSREGELIIFDRYIYDELANLPLHNRLTRVYVKLISLIVPRPDIAYLLDADPEAARARKPEYPVEFLRESRSAYKDLALLMRCMTFIPALPLEQAKLRVEQAFWLAAGQPAAGAEAVREASPDAAPAA
jgi:thymidylate kinase